MSSPGWCTPTRGSPTEDDGGTLLELGSSSVRFPVPAPSTVRIEVLAGGAEPLARGPAGLGLANGTELARVYEQEANAYAKNAVSASEGSALMV